MIHPNTTRPVCSLASKSLRGIKQATQQLWARIHDGAQQVALRRHTRGESPVVCLLLVCRSPFPVVCVPSLGFNFLSILSFELQQLSRVVCHRLLHVVHHFGQSRYVIVEFRRFLAKTINFFARSQRVVVHEGASPQEFGVWYSNLPPAQTVVVLLRVGLGGELSVTSPGC